MKPSRVLHIVLALAAAFSVVFLVATYGTALLAAPFASVQLNGPTAADSDGKRAAIIDTESRRVLILNDEGDLTGVVDCTTFDSPIEVATAVSVSNDFIYVAGIKYYPDSENIEKERVVVYDKGGNERGVVYEHAGGKGGDLSFLGEMQDSVIVANIDYESVSFVYVDGEESKEISRVSLGDVALHSVAYSAENNQYASLSIRGLLSDNNTESQSFPGRVFTAIDVGDDGILYACDDRSGALCAIATDETVREIVDGKGFEAVHANNGVVSVCDTDLDVVMLCDEGGQIAHTLTSIVPSLGFSLRMLVVWACAIYLVLLAVVLAVRNVRRLVAAGETDGFGPMLMVVAVIAAVGVAIASLSYSSYQQSMQTRANEINLCADYLIMESNGLSTAMENCNDRDALRKSGTEYDTAINSMIDVMSKPIKFVTSGSINDIGLYCVLYGKDDHGIFYLCDSSGDYVLGTTVLSETGNANLTSAFEQFDQERRELYQGRALRDATQYRLVQIPTSDGKGVAGVIEIGSKIRSFETALAAGQAQRLLALLVMVLVVYLTYSELRACGRCLFSYRKLQERHASDAVAALTRPFTFGITLLQGIDSVMTVLIARELLTASGAGGDSPLVAIPAVMLGLGLFIGQLLYGRVGSRIGLRRLMAGGAFAMLLCACFAAAVVFSGNFWLYCAAKLLLAIPFGTLYALGYSLPRIAESDEARSAAAGGVKRTDTSAAALGTVLGGYAAQTLGNAWVYVLVAIACLPVLVMALNLLPRHAAPLEDESVANGSRGSVSRFIKTPIPLALAFLVVLPATLAAGYTSFLFPLFSADLGLTKSEINNIFVLGQLVVYVCISSIDLVEARRGKWLVSTIAVALLGVVFLLFSLNATLVWSIVVIAIVGVLGKSSDGWKAMWLHAARAADVPAGRATGAMFATRSLALLVQPFILGALLGVADSVAVIVIGAICVVCAGVFFLVTRRSSLPDMR